MNGKAASWVAGAVVLAAILIGGAWFALISPKLAETAEVVSQTEAIEANNELIRLKNLKLAADFAKLDEYREQIAEVRERLPHEVALTDLTRTLDNFASDHELTIIGVSPSTPVSVASEGEQGAPAAPTPSEDEQTDGGQGAEGGETPARTEPTGEEILSDLLPEVPKVNVMGLYAVPVSVSIVGTLHGVEGLIEDLQNKLDRTYLISDFNMTSQPEADATGGKPATELGDVEVVLNGYFFVLRDYVLAAEEVEELLGPITPVDPKDLPGSNRNPFPPLTGSPSNPDSDDES